MRKRIVSICIAFAAVLICCMGCQSKVFAADTAETPKEQFLYQYNSTYQGIELTKYQGKDTVVTVPAEIDGIKVTAVGEKCFYKKKNLTAAALPDTVVSIGDEAFAFCSALERITLPKNLISIGKKAFIMCKLRSFSMPDSVTELGTEAFSGCRFLEEVVCSRGLLKLDSAFSGCENLKTVHLLSESKLTEIGEDAFFQCSSLKEITIPKSVTQIAENAFFYSGLEKITFMQDSMLKNIGSEAFAYTNLKEIQLPDSLTELGQSAFLGCKYLEKAICSKNLVALDAAFSGCENLKTVRLPKSPAFTRIGAETFYGCKSLKKIKIPASVTEIGVQAFYMPLHKGTAGLEKITFAADSHLKVIEARAFCFTGLKTIKLPASIERLEDFIFDRCSKLKKISFVKNAKLKKIPDSCIGYCIALEELDIPENVTAIGDDLFKRWDSTGWGYVREVHFKGGKIKKFGSMPFHRFRSKPIITVPQKYFEHYTKILHKQKWYKKYIKIKAVKKI